MKEKRIIDRTFNAPINKVWAAFTNPKMLAKWWSPAGMKNQHASTDAREGGEFRYCFESSEGVKYWGKGVYQTINEPTYLSYVDNFTDSHGTPVPPSHYAIPGSVARPICDRRSRLLGNLELHRSMSLLLQDDSVTCDSIYWADVSDTKPHEVAGA